MSSRLLVLIILLHHCVILTAAHNEHARLIEKAEHLLHSDNEKALATAKTSLDIAREQEDTAQIALSLRTIGKVHYFRHAFYKALPSYQSALTYYQAIGDLKGQSACYHNIGRICLFYNLYEEAETYLRASLDIDIKIDDTPGQAYGLHNLGELYHLQERLLLALHYYQSSLAIELKTGNNIGAADSYQNIATVFKDKEMYEEALSYYKKALKIYEEADIIYRLGMAHNNIGLVHYHTSAYHASLDAYKTSLHYRRKASDYQGEISTLLNMGYVYMLMRDTMMAKEVFVQALMREISFYQTYTDSELDSIMAAFDSIDDFIFFLVNNEVETGYFYTAPQRLYYRGHIYYTLGAYKEAIPFFLNSIELAEPLEQHSIIKKNYQALSEAYYKSKMYEKAAYYALQYITIADNINKQALRDFHSATFYNKTSWQEIKSLIKPDVNIKYEEKLIPFYRSFWFYCSLLLTIIIIFLIFKQLL